MKFLSGWNELEIIIICLTTRSIRDHEQNTFSLEQIAHCYVTWVSHQTFTGWFPHSKYHLRNSRIATNSFQYWGNIVTADELWLSVIFTLYIHCSRKNISSPQQCGAKSNLPRRINLFLLGFDVIRTGLTSSPISRSLYSEHLYFIIIWLHIFSLTFSSSPNYFYFLCSTPFVQSRCSVLYQKTTTLGLCYMYFFIELDQYSSICNYVRMIMCATKKNN